MRDDEFQEERRPGSYTGLGSPARQRLGLETSKQGAALEWPVHDDRNAPLLGQRQQALIGFTIQDVVGELNKVEVLGLDHPGEFGMPPTV